MSLHSTAHAMGTIGELLSSRVKNKSILLIQPGNNVAGFSFCGLNITDGDVTEYNVFDDVGMELRSYYDYIIIHGFLFRTICNDLSIISNINLKCDVFLIDVLGEGYSLQDELVTTFDFNLISYNQIKILAPFDDYSGLDAIYPNISFFKYPFAGPRNFCSKHNHMIHIPHTNHPKKVLVGLNWNDGKKEKLFTCLNYNPHPHRVIMVDSLSNHNLLNLGYVSLVCVDDEWSNIFHVDSDGNEHLKKIKNTKIIIDDEYEERFSLQSFNRNAYIDVVTETDHGILKFMTEKSMKPFYNLQLPIIFGYTGIVNDLRELGFDMFDDVINHSYDKLKVSDNITVKSNPKLISFSYNHIAIEKAKMISEELIRLSKFDFHSIYLDLKERLIHNQNLLYKLTIEDNSLVEDYGKWIFGDNITFNKNDYTEKIYI